MSVFLDRISIILIIVLTAVSSSALGDNPPIDEQLKLDSWVRYDIGSVTLYTNASRLKSDRIAVKLNRFIKFIESTGGSKTAIDSRPLDIYIFSKHSEYLQFVAPELIGSSTVGFAMSRENRLAIALSLEWPAFASNFLFHEFLHYLQFKKSISLPLWFVEGEAEFFSSASLREGIAKVGAPIPRIGKADARATPLNELLSLESLRDIPEKDAGKFYLDSWAFVHYLYMYRESGERNRMQQASSLIALVNNGVSLPEAVKASFGKPIDVIESEYLLHRRKLFEVETAQFLFQVEFDEPEEVFSSVAMSREQAAKQLGDFAILISLSKSPLAAKLLPIYLESNPESVSSLLSLAEAELVLGDFKAAIEILDRMKDDDYELEIERGKLFLKHASKSNDRYSLEQKKLLLASARKIFHNAIALDSNQNQAWIWLGLSYTDSTSDNASEGITALNQAKTLGPLHPRVHLELGKLYMRAKDHLNAIKCFDEVVDIANDKNITDEALLFLAILNAS